MKFHFDHDLHIHSQLSLCAKDPEQTNERILQYAKENGLHTVCLTDHFWDEDAPTVMTLRHYQKQNFPYISRAKPLPKDKRVTFLFGCEAELDRDYHLGITKKRFDQFDFVIIPTTHMHEPNQTISEEDGKNIKTRARAWVKRLDFVLNQDLPFRKIGIPHLTTGLCAPGENMAEFFSLISDDELFQLFKKAAEKGVGIELNAEIIKRHSDILEDILRPYRIAKECGCQFYCGSDAHTPEGFENIKEIYKVLIESLELDEKDKFQLIHSEQRKER
ncbi:MAG: PHP domain-containing protein [Ruminococcaceae bacterium]|nr:PHP domain-containing protein [Oscillospiraceae bacterium]